MSNQECIQVLGDGFQLITVTKDEIGEELWKQLRDTTLKALDKRMVPNAHDKDFINPIIRTLEEIGPVLVHIAYSRCGGNTDYRLLNNVQDLHDLMNNNRFWVPEARIQWLSVDEVSWQKMEHLWRHAYVPKVDGTVVVGSY